LPSRKSSRPRLATKPNKLFTPAIAQQTCWAIFFGAYNPTSFQLKT
jgi:hypothetical protein